MLDAALAFWRFFFFFSSARRKSFTTTQRRLTERLLKVSVKKKKKSSAGVTSVTPARLFAGALDGSGADFDRRRAGLETCAHGAAKTRHGGVWRLRRDK